MKRMATLILTLAVLYINAFAKKPQALAEGRFT